MTAQFYPAPDYSAPAPVPACPQPWSAGRTLLAVVAAVAIGSAAAIGVSFVDHGSTARTGQFPGGRAGFSGRGFGQGLGQGGVTGGGSAGLGAAGLRSSGG